MNKNKIEYFISSSCGVCKMTTPKVLDFQAKGNNVTIVNVSDSDEDKQYAKEVVGISSLPTLVVYDEQYKEIKRHTGWFNEIEEIIK